MGMFDYITVDEPYNKDIDERVRGARFQTKDLENSLLTYQINSTGQLVESYTADRTVTLNYHGDIYFYISAGNKTRGDYEWFEYQARFTHGTLESVTRVYGTL